MLPSTNWTIDRRPVSIEDFSAEAQANLGYGQMRGILRASDARALPTSVKQGSKIRGYTAYGRQFYEGRISATPTIQRGLAIIAAQGEAVRALKRQTRILAQSRNVSGWTQAGNNPHLYPQTEARIHVAVNQGGILFTVEPVAIAINEGQAVAFWTPGQNITRVAYSWKQGQVSNYDIKINRATGPSGALTLVHTQSLGAVTSGTVDTAISTPEDMVVLQLQANANNTPPPLAMLVTDLRVNGITTGDTYTTSQMATYIGGELGLNTSRIPSSSLNILPFDWTSGWADALTYGANLEDWVWGIYEDPTEQYLGELVYQPWGAEQWTTYQGVGARVSLDSMELFNGVTVKYRDIAAPTNEPNREITVMADPDPLVGTDMINLYPVVLADPQADSTLAQEVASILLPQVSQLRLIGRVETPHLWNRIGVDVPFESRPGATLRVPDFFPGTMRIFGVGYTKTGVTLGIEAPVSAFGAITAAELIAQRAPSLMGLPEFPPPEGPDLTPSAYREQWGAPTPTREEILAAGSWERWKWLNRK